MLNYIPLIYLFLFNLIFLFLLIIKIKNFYKVFLLFLNITKNKNRFCEKKIFKIIEIFYKINKNLSADQIKKIFTIIINKKYISDELIEKLIFKKILNIFLKEKEGSLNQYKNVYGFTI